MSTLLTRKMIFPVWMGTVLALFTSFGPTLTPALGSLLVFTAIVPAAVMLILSSPPPLTLSEAIAEELRPVGRSREQG